MSSKYEASPKNEQENTFFLLWIVQQGFESMNVALNKMQNQIDKNEAILTNLPQS
jgi:primase-polymerase (primpol)-like protein